MAAFQKTRFSSLLRLWLLGTESIQYVEKGNAVVHQHLLFEMGADHSDDTEPDDMWSQAYEANPHVFELDNGGLMVSFTFSETVDTILPVAPETLYEIEERLFLYGR